MRELTWRQVFDCYNVFPETFDKCKEIAKGVGYNYMSFNGYVCSVDANSVLEFVLLEDELQ